MNTKITPQNPHLEELETDFLYHFGLDASMDLEAMFGDTKFVCMGGSALRAEIFAQKLAEELEIALPENGPQPIGKTERFSLYKIGPVISVNHGMGMPSLSILLHEITKLLHYAGAADVTYLRIGTSGGLGVKPGTVVVADEGLNGELEPTYKLAILGKIVERPTQLDMVIANEIMACRGEIEAVIGKTCGTDCFYEGQARLDGAICEYTEKDKMEFLQKAHDKGVRNFEMEAPEFAAFCKKLNIPAADLCTTLLNRFNGDQVTSTKEELAAFSDNAQRMAITYIKKQLANS